MFRKMTIMALALTMGLLLMGCETTGGGGYGSYGYHDYDNDYRRPGRGYLRDEYEPRKREKGYNYQERGEKSYHRNGNNFYQEEGDSDAALAGYRRKGYHGGRYFRHYPYSGRRYKGGYYYYRPHRRHYYYYHRPYRYKHGYRYHGRGYRRYRHW